MFILPRQKKFGPNVADLFSTDLYNEPASGSLNIISGLDMTGKGGLVWTKPRANSYSHALFDTLRGAGKALATNNSNQQDNGQSGNLFAFRNDGFTVKGPYYGGSIANVAWSFLCAAGFFDIVFYTGNGVSGRQIPHNLGVAPGMITVKMVSAGDGWGVFHRGIGSTKNMFLNTTGAATTSTDWPTAPTSTSFTVSATGHLNSSNQTYVAYLWAQNPDLIDCGSYTGNGSATGPIVTCGSGWMPQWLLIKRVSAGGDNWLIYDLSRNTSNPRTTPLFPDYNGSESSSLAYGIDFTSTGFQPKTTYSAINGSAETYAYMAIRAEGA